MDGMRDREPGPSRPLLVLGLGLLVLAGVLLAVSLAFGAAESAGLRSLGRTLRAPLVLLVLVGCVLALVGYALRPRPEDSPRPDGNTTWLVGESTDFVRSFMAPDTGIGIQHRGLRPPAAQWTAQVFEDIEWRRFEAVCAGLFAQAGLQPRDGGGGQAFDLWLQDGEREGPAALLLCRHPAGPVGVDDLREFALQMARRGLQRGILATGGSFTPEAREFALAQGIDTLDAADLLQRIGQRQPQQQQLLLALAYEGEYWRPTCARCGLKMVESTVGRRHEPLWTCADAPRCRFTLPLRPA